LVEEVGRFVAREMESSSVRLAVRLEAALPLVAADEAQVRQALLNLLRNAREAMPGGGEVGLEARSIGGGVEIRVTDAGPGIAAETREHLFEMFYSTKERGTGLGLPLTQQIVAAHGGRIRCEDGASGGSVFSMWFPAVTEASEASDLASTPREAPRPVEAAADAS
jgi:signal transduction histidine kinase